MSVPFRILVLVGLLVAEPAAGRIAGGGDPARDCWMEFEAPHRTLNFPRAPRLGREVRCFDGEAGCDVDGEVDGTCTFDVDVCFYNTDPDLPSCSPAEVTGAVVKKASRFPGLAALQSAIDALGPVATPTCTSGQTLAVPLRVAASGKYRWNRERVAVRTLTVEGKAIDRLRLSCMPNDWASEGFDRRNSRSKSMGTGVDASSVSLLAKAWEFDVGAQPLFPTPAYDKANVSGSPTVMDGRVFVASANGFVYAFDAKSGNLDWEYKALETQYHAQVPGIYSSVTLTADGRAVVGDGAARVHVLDQRSGKRLWRVSVGNPVLDHIWASPAVSNGRVYVGVASHFDTPCVRGRLVALDLEDGTELWTRYMVPENVCDNDLDVACTSDADCGLGSCVEARGAGITGTVALDALGESLYVNTVGCGSFPSMGHSESVLKVDAATGDIVWAARMAAREQFGHCAGDDAIECGSDAACPPDDVCVPHSAGTGVLAFRDFGFVPGPMLVDVGGQTVVVAAAKEGVAYALDEATGSLVWSNRILPEPPHAGQGHFSGGLGHRDGKLFAALGSFFIEPKPAFQQVALNVDDGSTAWTESLGATYSGAGVVDGVFLSGSPPGLVAQDPATGAVLAELELPAAVQSAPVIVDGMVYVGWGSWLDDTGGITAFEID